MYMFNSITGHHPTCRLARVLGQPESTMATANPESKVLRSDH